MAKSNAWIMPDWMKPYTSSFTNLGREATPQAIEELFNGNTSPEVNMPLAMTEASAFVQVCLLEALHRKGRLC